MAGLYPALLALVVPEERMIQCRRGRRGIFGGRQLVPSHGIKVRRGGITRTLWQIP
jgi:hypothetical protein